MPHKYSEFLLLFEFLLLQCVYSKGRLKYIEMYDYVLLL